MVSTGSPVRIRAAASRSSRIHPTALVAFGEQMFDEAKIGRRSLKYALRPTVEQREALARAAGARRFIYNWALERWLTHYRQHGSTIPANQLFRELTELKGRPGHEWLRDIDSQLLQQAVIDLCRAFVNFFERRSRFPRFKSRKSDRARFRIPQRVRVEGDRIYVPKVGWVRLRLSRPVSGAIKSATFARDACGTWHVTLVCEFLLPPAVPLNVPPSRSLGVDLGLIDFLVASDGRRVPRPRFIAQADRGLRRARRDLSRKQRGSRRRAKARRRLARVERGVANRRQDFLHKLTSQLVREHDLICIENLGIAGLARTKLSRAMYDAALGEFRRQVVYKAAWQGKHCVVIDRFFPSSRRCSACGSVNRDLTPRERSWVCVCGAVHDRDLNAARNILTEGRRLVAVGHTDTENARGARVSLPMGAAGAEARIAAA